MFCLGDEEGVGRGEWSVKVEGDEFGFDGGGRGHGMILLWSSD